MKRLVGWSLSVASLAMVGLMPVPSEAFGRRGGGCDVVCVVPCPAPVVCAAPEIRYEERQITYQKPVWRDQVVEQTLIRCVPRQEKFEYDVRVPRFREEQRTVQVTRPVLREEKHVVKVAHPVHSVEKRTVAVNVPQWRDVEYSYTVNVPRFRQVARTVPVCHWETRHVETMAPVCHVVPEVCTDACGRCYTVCRTVTTMQPVTRAVRVPVHGTREVMVNECYFEQEDRTGVRKVCEFIRQEREIEVPVCHVEYRDVEQVRMVCDHEVVDQEITVRVCEYVTEKREGVRTVFDRVEDKVSRTIRVCEYETVTDVVRVPVTDVCHHGFVSHGCCDPCNGGRRGLFGRRR